MKKPEGRIPINFNLKRKKTIKNYLIVKLKDCLWDLGIFFDELVAGKHPIIQITISLTLSAVTTILTMWLLWKLGLV
ncbi:MULTISPECIES: hypothetical protein [unclassified Enterococcus]|uniref:hypothetical protein n=1 Tax=unclassified Enterococcus TaxID=2608891 RepID=UPI0015542E5B|nr:MULTISPECIES: hypothetical protein [unclassified Enterococcus]MBS7577483.1 hypothetical protein [Enterococcus sp. MMGLQ5-2]MBS7585018.1 hypothetical protein [Enterococcus sp. MMGLQ5-1]NPD12874.1 hypothetical protein [Enterococcus sp. MMGLQ5-1]NPD37315.1 hypothetical protein [Enterococcus sp. MMGLQ5-2]